MFAIIVSSVRRKLTNRSVLLNLVVMPLLLIVILGNALASTFTHSTSSADSGRRTTLAVVDDAHTTASTSFVRTLSTSGVFTIRTSTPAQAQAALADGSVDVVATIPSGFTGVATEPAPSVRLSAVNSRIDNLRAAQVAIDSVGDRSRAVTASAEHAAYTGSNYLSAPTSTAQDPSAGVSGITYYTVTMLVLILMYGLGNTMNFVKDEYDGPLGDRYLASPTGVLRLVSAEVISGTLTSVLQAAVIVTTAVTIFGADLGARPWVAAVIVLVCAVLFNSVGLLLGVLGRTRPWLDPVVSLLIPVMTFFGGGFVKLDLGGLDKLAVNSIFQSAFFREISGYTVRWSPLVTSALVAAGALLAAAAFLGPKGATR